MKPVLLAHEVYVLNTKDMQTAMLTDSPNPFVSLKSNATEFALWGIGILVLVIIVFRMAFWKRLRRFVSPKFDRLKKHAPNIVRVTLAVCIGFSAYSNALFGPELSLPTLFGSYASAIQILLYASAAMLLFKFWTKLAAAIIIFIFLSAFLKSGNYVIAYLGYLGAALFVMLPPHKEWSFLLLRVCYGSSIIFAAIFAKLIHSNLALMTIKNYHLTNTMHFEPMFLVLGALIIECAIGVCIIIGFELRFSILAFMGFLVSSLLFFGEAIWPHLILFGLNAAIFAHGYDRYTLFRRRSARSLEPAM